MNFSPEIVAEYRHRLTEIREQGRQLFESGAPGIPTAASLSQAFDKLVLDLWNDTLKNTPQEFADKIAAHSAIVAVGGTGRGELCPYSDVDLLFLDGGPASALFKEAYDRMIRTCWDAKLEPGASLRTIPQSMEDCRTDPKFASGLVEARLLWGSQPLIENLQKTFRREIIRKRTRQFIDECVRCRESEWKDGRAVQELEPDVKNSSGGLRDLHLIRWVGFAVFGVADIDSLKLQGALEKDEAQALKQAWEFLTWLRINLHYHSGQAEEKFSRGEQLRIAQERGLEDQAGQRGVERLMREYFQHTSRVASIARRFVARNRPRSLMTRVRNYLVGHRAEGVLHVGEVVDCSHRGLPAVTRSVDTMLKVYRLCASQGLLPGPTLEEGLKRAASKFRGTPITQMEAGRFLDILKYGEALPQILRSMVETEVLDLVLPEFTRIRCLLQFNPYHHFTVDEHTLRAIGIVTRFPDESGPLVQQVYRELQNKHLLHLALILHDIGKGFEEDHCLVGERIAHDVGKRFGLPKDQTELLAFLVRWHLEMADIAFRRDHTDEAEIVPFSQKCESPERLQMLYALTVADVSAVGPGTWSHWKALQLGEFYDRCFVVLSGRHYGEYEAARLKRTTGEVAEQLSSTAPDIAPAWIESAMSDLSAYYLTCTESDRIAADLRILHGLSAENVIVDSQYEPNTGTCEYRIFTRNTAAAQGCFHRLAGVLTAMRHRILSAAINTTQQGAVIDSFQVRDRDFDGEPTPDRREAVARAMQDVLLKKYSVEELFRKNRRFGASRPTRTGGELPTRVRIDSSSSESRTIVEVFAHDRSGLLYSVSKAIHDLNLSVDLAKIATHLNQVLDVFYVRELDGSKVTGEDRLRQIQTVLEAKLSEFENTGWKEFA